jgi:hypothetical protein
LEIPADYAIASFSGDEITSKGFNGFIVLNSVVSHKNDSLYSKTIIYKEFISSVVNHSQNFDDVYWGIKRVENTGNKFQSAAVRAFAIDELQEVLGIKGLVINKNADEVPVLVNGNEEIGVAVSLSHHERWVGYSFGYSP